MSQTSTSPDTTPTSDDAQEPRRLLLIDGHSMAFRAFYALPVDNFTTSTGQATNAVHGFTSMFLSLLEGEAPTHAAVAFDLPGGPFRTEEYAEYKGTREETPQPFTGQVELIEEVLGAMGVRTITAPGYEADDILATLAASAQDEGLEVLVCSGDRDSFQTVTERCTVLYPVKGVSTLRRMTPQEVEERYGVTPERYPDLAALVGETSDNLPGVPGVGPKTAAKWIGLYDGLEGVIAHAEDIKGKAGQSLRDHLDEVLRNRRLNRLVTDLDLGLSIGDLRLEGADRAGLARVFETLEFRTLHQRSQRILSFAQQEGAAPQADDEGPMGRLLGLEVGVLGHDLEPGGLGAWLQEHLPVPGPGSRPAPLGIDVVGALRPVQADAQIVSISDGASAVAILGHDLEPGGLGAWLQEHLPAPGPGSRPAPLGIDVVGALQPVQADAQIVSISDGASAVAIDTAELSVQDEAVLEALLADVERPKIVADAKGAWHALKARGLSLDGVIADPCLAGYLCRPEQRSYDVDTLAQRWLDIDLAGLADGAAQETGSQQALDLDSLSSGAAGPALASARRAAVLLPLQEVLEAQMEQRRATALFTDLEMPVAATLAVMEDAGIAVDDAVLATRATELDARVTHAAQGAFAAAGHELNLSSPKQLQTVLFDELRMPKTRRTKTGYTTDAEALAGLPAKTGHPFLAHLRVPGHRRAAQPRQGHELRPGLRAVHLRAGPPAGHRQRRGLRAAGRLLRPLRARP